MNTAIASTITVVTGKPIVAPHQAKNVLAYLAGFP
jgi:hypothetical protein